MSHNPPFVEDLSRDQARAILTTCMDKLLHDIICECPQADIGRGMAMLARADWTVREAFEAWYSAWIEEPSHA